MRGESRASVHGLGKRKTKFVETGDRVLSTFLKQELDEDLVPIGLDAEAD